MNPFQLNDRVTLVKPDGTRFEEIPANVQPSEGLVVIYDVTLPIEEGDRIERSLPSGLTEAYQVDERGYKEGNSAVRTKPRFHVQVSKSTGAAAAGGMTVYNLSGPNSRVVVQSTDSSVNVVSVGPERLFDEMRAAFGSLPESQRDRVLGAVTDLERAAGTPSFGSRYAALVSAASDHMTLLAPFMPAIGQMLGQAIGT